MSVLPVGFGSAAGGGAGGDKRSVRFNPADNAYLNRTFSTPTNNKIWTWSSWVKKSALGGSGQELLFAFPDGSNYAYIQFTSGDALELGGQTGGVNFSRITSAVFRDLSAWYAINVIVDTTLATANDRIKIYVNNVLQTLTGTAPTQNSNLVINTAVAHQIGRHSASSNYYFGGYLAEVYFIDGQALTPSSFGQFNAQTGVWEPITYVGTYGTNGFYLPFNIDSTALVPGAPTIGTATLSGSSVSVSFTPPANVGGSAITSYTVTSTPGGVTASGATSPITVTGLTPNTSYTFKVKATNSFGTGAESAASNSVTTPAITYITATGGTESTSGNYKFHTFTSSGTFTVTAVGSGSAESNSVDYLIVAGGGGGGARNAHWEGGGGGAGGMLNSSTTVTATNYTITVGGGGSGGASAGSQGSSSSAFSATSIGGGYGGGGSSGGGSGGSGGGSGWLGSGGGSGTSGQGNSGGTYGADGSTNTGGGGGGRGGSGGNGSGGGYGGSGQVWSPNGTTYAGGGGGGRTNYSNGGSGGGGAGQTSGSMGSGTAGATNTGGGGGGGWYNFDPSPPGANGGSGIVIIRYRFQ